MSEATEEPQVRAGEVVAGKYRVERVIGAGGMGFVVAATHDQLDQRVALKFLLPAIAQREELVQRFMREARAAVKIQSEHVARVFDVGKHEDLPFMVMEYLEGSDLAETLRQGPVSVRDAAAYVLEACDAVAEAHALGIVHRDIKPANLFLANRARGKPIVKVLDFGISKAPTSEKDRNITNATAIMGSPSYMSPEQMVASASVDPRSDVWSLGVTLYELVTGTLPFHAESMPELVGVILQGDFAPPSRTRPDVPAALESVIARCLEKDRERRFQTVGELARALLPFAPSSYQALVDRIDGIAGTPSSRPPARVAPATSASPPESRTLAPTVHPAARSKTSLWLGVAAVCAIGLGVGVFAVIRRGGPATGSLQSATNATPVATSAAPPSATSAELPKAVVPPEPEPSVVPSATALHAHAGHPPPRPAPSASAPACKTVAYFDADGNKHFKLDCTH